MLVVVTVAAQMTMVIMYEVVVPETVVYVVVVPVMAIYVVDVAVVVVVTCAGPTAGTFLGTRTTSATRIMHPVTRILIASCLFKTILSRCWVRRRI
jgi:hypothetical protein